MTRIDFQSEVTNLAALNGGNLNNGVLEYRWSLFKVDESFTKTVNEASLGINIPGVDFGVTFEAHAYAELYASLKMDVGSVVINYAIDAPDIFAPGNVRKGFNLGGSIVSLPYFSHIQPFWDTSGFTYVNALPSDPNNPMAQNGQELPRFQTQSGNLANSSFAVSLDYDIGGSISNAFVDILGWELDQGDLGFPNPLSIGGGQSRDLFKVDGEDASISLDGLFPGLTGSLTLPPGVPDRPLTQDPAPPPDFIPVPPTGYYNFRSEGDPQLPTLKIEGDAPNFFSMNWSLVTFLATALVPLRALRGKFEYDDGDSYLAWTVLDLVPHIGVQMSDELAFDPSNVLVHMEVRDSNGNLVQELDGTLGQKFNFEQPDDVNGGEGTMTVTPTYTLVGEFSNTLGVKVNGGITFNVLGLAFHNELGPDFDWAFGPLLSYEIPPGGFASDRVDLITNTTTAIFDPVTGTAMTLGYFRNYFGTPGNDEFTMDEGVDQTEIVYAGEGNDLVVGNSSDNFGNQGGLYGEGGNDSLVGDGGSDELRGGDGNDILIGDFVFAGNGFEGNDSLFGGFGSDKLYGGGGNDLLSTGDGVSTAGGRDELYGGTGDDVLVSLETEGSGKSDILDGGEGFDTLTISRSGLTSSIIFDVEETGLLHVIPPSGNLAGLTIDGLFLPDGTQILDIERIQFQSGAGDDEIFGGAFDDFILGGAGKDSIDSRGGRNFVAGQGGSDRLIIRQDEGRDIVLGGSGIDTLVFFAGEGMGAGGFGMQIDLRDQTPTFNSLFPTVFGDIPVSVHELSDGTGISSIEKLEFYGVAAEESTDIIHGGALDDIIEGGGGSDIINGGGGADILRGGLGDDLIITDGLDTVNGCGGEDILVIQQVDASVQFTFQTNGVGSVNRGAPDSNGRAVLSAIRVAEIIPLPGGGTAKNVERMSFVGSDTQILNDQIFGGTGADFIQGGNGDDILSGGGGIDEVYGNDGDDRIYISRGEGGHLEIADGGAGDDLISIDLSDQFYGSYFELGAPSSIMFTNDGTRITGFEHVAINGTAFDDHLIGGDADARFHLEPLYQTDSNGDYVLTPSNLRGGGERILIGQSNVMDMPADVLVGGAGDDYIDGKGGADFIDGGSGNDFIVLSRGKTPGTFFTGGGDAIDGGGGVDTLIIDLSRDDLPFIRIDAPVQQSTRGATTQDEVTKLSDGTNLSRIERLVTINSSQAINALLIGGAYGNDEILGTSFNDTLAGNAGNDILAGGLGADSLDGGAGVDTASYYGGSGVTFTFGTSPGLTASLKNSAQNTGEAQGDAYTSIENLTGTVGSDHLIGDDQDNVLRGEVRFLGSSIVFTEGGLGGRPAEPVNFEPGPNLSFTTQAHGGNDLLEGFGGNDSIFGSFGNDILRGGTGNDVLAGGDGNDTMDGGDGIDTASYEDASISANVSLLSSRSLDTGSGRDRFLSIENLIGSEFADKLRGNNFENAIAGAGGNDIVLGLSGNDALMGDDGDDHLYGGSDNDSLYGGRGDDRLYGEAGRDQLFGGAGNDLYYIGDSLDSVFEIEHEGTFDRIFTTVSYQLDLNSEVEYLYAAAGNMGLTIFGSSFINFIFGGSGNDTLKGRDGDDVLNGAQGIDVLDGGTGNDKFYIDDVDDQVVEARDGGRADKVFTSRDYRLAEENEIEYLYANAGAMGLNLAGNEFDNFIYGNGGNDSLKGEGGNDALNGGRGVDVLRGGSGNDKYYVDEADDQCLETIGNGVFDKVYTRVDYELNAGSAIEYLYANAGSLGMILTGNEFDNYVYGSNGGSDQLYGSAGNDKLFGQAGNDRLSGGTGVDSLYGGAGNDVFVLRKFANDRDIVHDFVAANDQFEISAQMFGAGLLAGSTLMGLQFVANNTGIAGIGCDLTTRFIYSKTTGALYFDADGTGVGARVQIATLYKAGDNTSISGADFIIVT